MFSASSKEKNKKLEIKAGSKDSFFWTLFPSLKKKNHHYHLSSQFSS